MPRGSTSKGLRQQRGCNLSNSVIACFDFVMHYRRCQRASILATVDIPSAFYSYLREHIRLTEQDHGQTGAVQDESKDRPEISN